MATTANTDRRRRPVPKPADVTQSQFAVTMGTVPGGDPGQTNVRHGPGDRLTTTIIHWTRTRTADGPRLSYRQERHTSAVPASAQPPARVLADPDLPTGQ